MTDPAGRLSDEQLELMLRSMPIGLSVADEADTVRFWAAPASTRAPPQVHRPRPARVPSETRARGPGGAARRPQVRAKDEVDTVEHGQHGSERIIYTALRDENGAYRGVLETVVPLTEDE